jgi:glycosyltransferase involved in cell wall biosynthesis
MGVDYILSKNRFIPKTKVEVCPNCIRPDNKTITTNSGVIRSKHNIPSDACVFLFSGNLGIGHGLAFLVKAIKSLKNYPKAYFVIGGSGTHFQFLKNRLKEFEHKNVFLYEWLPREDFTQILATIDVGLILLYRYTVPQFPSRLLSYLEYSKPVLCAVNKYTDIGTIVEKTGCGYAINHGDLDAFISAVKYLSENENERKNMGENGRKLLMDNYTASHGYNIIMNHFNV